MYIKVCLWNGNESENPFLISNFTKNNDLFEKMVKNTFVVKEILGQRTKHNFE